MKKKIAGVIAASAMLLQTAMPVFANTTLVVTGNGADSANTANVDLNRSTSVVQSNDANVKNVINAGAQTGGNEASKNTGGDVRIQTGDATVVTHVENALNTNQAHVDCCTEGDVEALISGNGADSSSRVNLGLSNNTYVGQTNDADVRNYVDATAKTGWNDATKNTGGDTLVRTGDATTAVAVETTGNTNSARVGRGTGGSTGLVSAWVVGNGADSRNRLGLDFENSLNVVQANRADVKNDVEAKATTGKNDAGKNTGGEVSVETGDADVLVALDTATNFNWADTDCGCLLEDVFAKVGQNGAYSDNKIVADFSDDLGVFQSNCGDEHGYGWHHNCGTTNVVDAYGTTGKNDADKNTGWHGADPSVQTGDAYTEVVAENSGNTNLFGSAPSWNLPLAGGNGVNVNVTFNLSDLLRALGH